MRSVGVIAVGVALASAVTLSGCAPDTTPASLDEDVLTVFGPWRGEPAESLRGALADFTEETGVPVNYTGTGGFAAAILDRVADGDLPDVAVFPQPGLMNALAEQGHVRPLSRSVASAAAARYRPAVARAAESVGKPTGVLLRLNVKSLVWYERAAFEEQGYDVPRTWRELERLADTMAADGFVPWCLGVGSFSASGWPATDWVEDILLRQAGPSAYDSWVAGTRPFTDRAVSTAFTAFADLVLQPGRTPAGRRAALNTSVETAQDPMFTDPPSCLMYRQASFQEENLPGDVTVGSEGTTNVFILPSLAPDETRVVLGGDFVAAMSDRPEADDLLRFLATSDSALRASEANGSISPRSDRDPSDDDTIEATVAALLDNADVVRFDGSDAMVPAVGTRSFLDAMLYYIGTLRLDASLDLAQSGYDDETPEAGP